MFCVMMCVCVCVWLCVSSCLNYNLCSLCLMKWAGHVARMGEERGVYRVLVGKPEGKRPLGRPGRRWVDNIRTELQEVGYGLTWTRIETGGGRL